MFVDCDARGAAFAVPVKDKTGRDWYAVMLKITYAVDPSGRVELIEEQLEPRLVDAFWGDDGAASIRLPSELYEAKPGTDVILAGHAHAPLRSGASHVDVRITWGPVDKVLRVHGTRAFQKGASGRLVAGPARAIVEPVPLRWELAWGGADLTRPDQPLVEPRNPIGRGVAHDRDALVGTPAPQIEYLSRPVGSDDPIPAGFAPIHRHWQPRAAFAGTLDEVWQRTKMPLLPDDFDARFHVSVAHDQWSPTPLRGDELVVVAGATPEGLLRFQLPRHAIGVTADLDGAERSFRVQLDTAIFDADAMRAELCFRAAIPLPAKYERLGVVRVFDKEILTYRDDDDDDDDLDDDDLD